MYHKIRYLTDNHRGPLNKKRKKYVRPNTRIDITLVEVTQIISNLTNHMTYSKKQLYKSLLEASYYIDIDTNNKIKIRDMNCALLAIIDGKPIKPLYYEDGGNKYRLILLAKEVHI